MTDLDAALERARTEGKPILWFVPTAQRTPLDRRQELYWYMMGGAFSEPRVVNWIEKHFVALKLGFSPLLRGDDELATIGRRNTGADRYGLAAPTFVEPGFVILDPAGELVATIDRLLYFQVDWFGARMDRLLGPRRENLGDLRFPSPAADALAEVRAAMRAGDEAAALKALSAAGRRLEGDLAAEAAWIEGLAHWQLGDRDRATKGWRKLIETSSQSIWAARARLELEGWGPFRHGFAGMKEPDARLAASTDLRTSRVAGVELDQEERIRQGLRFLLRQQNPDGSWTDSRYDFGGADSLPNVHMAITALAARGLLEWLDLDREAVSAALDRALTYLLDDAHLATADEDEIIWAQVYRLDFMLRALELMPESKSKLKSKAQALVKAIEKDQLRGGGWRHEYPNPFASASALVVLKKASAAGLKVTDTRVDAAARAILGARDETSGVFGYTMRAGGSKQFGAGRMSICELALFLAGASDEERLAKAVATGLEHQAIYEELRNYDDHVAPTRIGGFFFWYDVHGRTEALLRLGEEARATQAEAVRRLVTGIQEVDGAWIDSHELGKSYGTGMALTVLGLLRDAASH